MWGSKTHYRVIYGDTDQMGVVYYGQYARFYEMGRSEMIREMGFTYRQLEEQGIAMPVYSVEARYRRAIRYDERIAIETTVAQLPAARMEFFHKIYTGSGELAHEATVALVFQDMKTGRLVRAPKVLTDRMEQVRNAGSGG